MNESLALGEYRVGDMIVDVGKALKHERLYLGRLLTFYSDAMRREDLDLAWEFENELNHIGRRFGALRQLQLKQSGGTA